MAQSQSNSWHNKTPPWQRQRKNVRQLQTIITNLCATPQQTTTQAIQPMITTHLPYSNSTTINKKVRQGRWVAFDK